MIDWLLRIWRRLVLSITVWLIKLNATHVVWLSRIGFLSTILSRNTTDTVHIVFSYMTLLKRSQVQVSEQMIFP